MAEPQRGGAARHGERRGATFQPSKEEVMPVMFAAATVTVSVAIGVVCLIAGGVSMYRGKMVLGVVLVIIGILLGGLSIFGAFD
jgi:hypothetical protein